MKVKSLLFYNKSDKIRHDQTTLQIGTISGELLVWVYIHVLLMVKVVQSGTLGFVFSLIVSENLH